MTDSELRALLLDPDPECPTALHPVQTLAALADYAERMSVEHPDDEDPDAVQEMVRDAIDVVRALQDFAFGAKAGGA